MKKDFTIKAKTYIIKSIEKNLYLDKFGYLSPYSKDFTWVFDTKKKAEAAYRYGHTAAACRIIEEKDRRHYETD